VVGAAVVGAAVDGAEVVGDGPAAWGLPVPPQAASASTAASPNAAMPRLPRARRVTAVPPARRIVPSQLYRNDHPPPYRTGNGSPTNPRVERDAKDPDPDGHPAASGRAVVTQSARATVGEGMVVVQGVALGRRLGLGQRRGPARAELAGGRAWPSAAPWSTRGPLLGPRAPGQPVARGREVGPADGHHEREGAAAEQQQRGERLLARVVGQRRHRQLVKQ
jgi:hypothetical protein